MNPIAKMLIDMGRFYGYELDERQLEMYVDVLSRFDPELVLRSGSEYVANIKNTKFPIPPHKILESHMPKEDDDSISRAAVARIVEAFTRFGYTNPDEAKEFVGELGWSVVKRSGGWVSLCHASAERTFNFETFAAQARDLAKAHLQLARAGRLDTPIGLPGVDDKVAIASGNTMKLIENLAKDKAMPGRGE